jgi:hypothetical protein
MHLNLFGHIDIHILLQNTLKIAPFMLSSCGHHCQVYKLWKYMITLKFKHPVYKNLTGIELSGL